ncbi:MAG: hypothetical protein U0105_16215 [Candidatus Obscuribacterales bacterium]
MKIVIPKAVISVFILLYVSAIWCYLQPHSRWVRNVLVDVEPTIMFLGLWQNYEVFSPDVRRANIRLLAEVQYADGQTSVWNYPQMEKLPYPERVVKERYRKLGLDYLNWEKYKKLWPDLARYIARQEKTQHGGTPVSVHLKRCFWYLPDARKALDGTAEKPQERTVEFFTYKVVPADLQ